MTEREQFEEWAKDKGYSLARFDRAGETIHGEYFMAATRGAWAGWQARAELADQREDDDRG